MIFALTALALCAPAWGRKPKMKDLIKNFESAKSEERVLLAAALGRAKDKAATDALLRAFDFKRGSPKESAALIDALAAAGDPRAVEPLAAAWDYLRSMTLQLGELPGHLQVLRWKILEALSRLGGDQAVAVLAEALNDKDLRVVEEAVRGMGRLQVKDAVPALQQLAGSATGNLLQAVLEALGDIGDRRALSTLEQASTNPDKYVEVEAAYALSKLGRKEAAGRLSDFLHGDPGEEKVGLMAAYYLVKLDKTGGLEHLEKMMKKPDSPLASLAAEVLGKTGNPRAVLVLLEALQASDSSVRIFAARSLGRLGGARAIAALRKLREDSNPGVRNASVSALADLGERD